MAEKKITAELLQKKFGVSIRAQFVPWSKSRSFDSKIGTDVSKKNLNWNVTLVHNGRDVMTTDYSAGCAHCPSYKQAYGKTNWDKRVQAEKIRFECERGVRAAPFARESSNGPVILPHSLHKAVILPDPADVLYSLLSDSEAIDYATYEEFADNFGYDPDSRKGEQVYRACLEIGLKLRSALGDAKLAQLRTLFEDY